MPETTDDDDLIVARDAHLHQAAANSQRDAWLTTHIALIEQRLTELESKINHADLPENVVTWLASLAENGAITGTLNIPSWNAKYAPVIQYSIFPDGKMWLQLYDMNMAPIWHIMLTGPGKIPDGR